MIEFVGGVAVGSGGAYLVGRYLWARAVVVLFFGVGLLVGGQSIDYTSLSFVGTFLGAMGGHALGIVARERGWSH